MSRLTKLLIVAAALLLVGGGTATAAKLITGKDVKNSSLTGADLKNGSVGASDLSSAAKKAMAGKAGAPGATGPAGPAGPAGAQGPQGPAGTPDGYTKGEADGRFLGTGAKAADTDKVDGVDGDDLVGGDAQVAWASFPRTANSAETKLIDLGDIGELRVTCGAGGTKTLEILNEAGSSLSVHATTVREGDTPLVSDIGVSSGAQAGLATSTADYSTTVQAGRLPAGNFVSKDFSTAIVTATDDNADCRFSVQLIDNEIDGPGDNIAP